MKIKQFSKKQKSIGLRYALTLLIVPLASPIVVSKIQGITNISDTILGPISILLLTIAYAWCIYSIKNSPNFGPSEEEKIAYQIKALNDHSIINMTDEKGVITYVNDKFLKTTGFSREELIGQNLAILLSESIAARFEFAKAYVLQGNTWSGEVRMVGKDGKSIWTYTTVAPQTNKAGKVIGTIAIQTDTTQTKISAAEKTMRKSLHLLHDEVYMFEADTLRYIYLNKAAMDNCRWDEKTYRQKTLVDKRREILKDETFDGKKFYDRARPLIKGEANEIEFILEDYEKIQHVKLQLIRPENGPAHFLSIGRDITEHRELEKTKAEFISTISHELRTPVTSIKGALGLILSGVTGPLTDKTQKMLDIAYKNSDRLTLIINDILDLEKLASGNMKMKLERIDLVKLVIDAINANKSYAAPLEVSLVGVGLEKQIYGFCDSDRVFQILNNLLSNAAKFSHKGGEVIITISENSDMVCIVVEDFGHGIPEEAQFTIFDRFTQADSSDRREKGGTGLGLSIVKSLVEIQGGSIHFTSEVDRGSKFSFELPKKDKTVHPTDELMIAAE